MSNSQEIVPQALLSAIYAHGIQMGWDPNNLQWFRKQGMKPNERIPRPPNQFMIFLSLMCQLKAPQPKELEKPAVWSAKVWKDMSKDAREPFAQMAALLKECHKHVFPDYIFDPGRKKNSSKEKTEGRKHVSTKTPVTTVDRTVSSTQITIPQIISASRMTRILPIPNEPIKDMQLPVPAEGHARPVLAQPPVTYYAAVQQPLSTEHQEPQGFRHPTTRTQTPVSRISGRGAYSGSVIGGQIYQTGPITQPRLPDLRLPYPITSPNTVPPPIFARADVPAAWAGAPDVHSATTGLSYDWLRKEPFIAQASVHSSHVEPDHLPYPASAVTRSPLWLSNALEAEQNCHTTTGLARVDISTYPNPNGVTDGYISDEVLFAPGTANRDHLDNSYGNAPNDVYATPSYMNAVNPSVGVDFSAMSNVLPPASSGVLSNAIAGPSSQRLEYSPYMPTGVPQSESLDVFGDPTESTWEIMKKYLNTEDV